MTKTPSCCAKLENDDHDHDHAHAHGGAKKFDVIYMGSVFLILASVLASTIWEMTAGMPPMWLHHFAHACLEILGTMWWGIALGIVIIGLMSRIPRDIFTAAMGRGDSFSGLLRAVFAGVFLDLCCHGILLVASKLYERGVSLAQVVAFLVASPWNSLSLTLVLVTLIGLKWTVLYVLGSMLIALVAGMIFQILTRTKILPPNPHHHDLAKDYNFKHEAGALLKSVRFTKKGSADILKTGWREGQMIIKWLLFGTVLAASIRTFIPQEVFADWFAPTMAGLFLTVAVAAVIEICSEGSAPLAGELFNGAAAPGNGFAFLMAGVATDYTEILVIREFTKSWKIALFLPLVTVPQVIFIAYIMNMAAVAG